MVLFYLVQKAKEKRKSKFEKRLVYLDTYQILADSIYPQTNGKLERLHGEIQRKLHGFEIMMRKSKSHRPVYEVVQATHVT